MRSQKSPAQQWKDSKVRLCSQREWWQMHVELPDGSHFIWLTATPTRKRQIDRFSAVEGAKVWSEQVHWSQVHPKARPKVLVCVQEPPRSGGTQ